MKKAIFTLITSITLGSTFAHADYHTVLVGVRLHLTTTTFETDNSYSSSTVNGFTQIFSSAQKSRIELSSNVLEGYIRRSSRDTRITISSSTKPTDLGKRAALFVSSADLVQLKFPRQVFAQTGYLQGLFIPFGIISKIEKYAGPYEGDIGMGEPFYIAAWQAALMKEKPPVYSCVPPTERGEIAWISYNPQVGEKELQKACERAEVDSAIVQPLLEKGNVFPVAYPAD